MKMVKWPQLDWAFYYACEHNLWPEKINVAEFGVGSGDSMKKIFNNAYYFRYKNINAIGFDSFAGLPAESEGIEKLSLYTEGAYCHDIDKVVKNLRHCNVELVKGNFSELNDKRFLQENEYYNFVHIDCDLYCSTVSALDYLFRNKLVKAGTLIAYDEFQSVDSHNGGEEKAHRELIAKYNIDCEEVWHYNYKDKTTGNIIRQNVFLIKGVPE